MTSHPARATWHHFAARSLRAPTRPWYPIRRIARAARGRSRYRARESRRGFAQPLASTRHRLAGVRTRIEGGRRTAPRRSRLGPAATSRPSCTSVARLTSAEAPPRKVHNTAPITAAAMGRVTFHPKLRRPSQGVPNMQALTGITALATGRCPSLTERMTSATPTTTRGTTRSCSSSLHRVRPFHREEPPAHRVNRRSQTCNPIATTR